MRVLHVDDDPRATSLLLRLLRGSDEVTGATNREEALDLLARKSWDVLVADGAAPGPSGAEFMREVTWLRPEMRRVILTRDPDDERFRYAKLAGWVDFVVAKTADAAVVRRALGLPTGRVVTPAGGTSSDAPDIRDFAELLVADLELDLLGLLSCGTLPPGAQEKIRYYLARTWDAGRASLGRPPPTAAR